MIRCVMAFHEDERTLAMAILSVLPHVDELVLIGGAWRGYAGPTMGRDASREIAANLAFAYPKITLIEPRLWESEMECLNAGLETLQEGDIYLRVDADEQFSCIPGALQQLPPGSAWRVHRTYGAENGQHYQTRVLRVKEGGLRYGRRHTLVHNGGPNVPEMQLHMNDPVLPGISIRDFGFLRSAERLTARNDYQRTVIPRLEART